LLGEMFRDGGVVPGRPGVDLRSKTATGAKIGVPVRFDLGGNVLVVGTSTMTVTLA
jgi:hypothetical protein